MKNKGKIFAVGIGPGSLDDLTPRAKHAIKISPVVVGYTKYCAMVASLLENKDVISTGMKAEVERCETALRKAAAGVTVSVISSGDAGIYGMAGLLIELAERDKLDVDIEVVPGVTAATAAAAVLGAPLMNDFAVISLSDLLTPGETIKRRLEAVAAADMVCVLYNPRSMSRTDLFDHAVKVFGSALGAGLIVGYVRHASRTEQNIWLGALGKLSVADIDMSTVVVFGCSSTAIVGGRMVTRRGYKGVGV